MKLSWVLTGRPRESHGYVSGNRRTRTGNLTLWLWVRSLGTESLAGVPSSHGMTSRCCSTPSRKKPTKQFDVLNRLTNKLTDYAMLRERNVVFGSCLTA